MIDAKRAFTISNLHRFKHLKKIPTTKNGQKCTYKPLYFLSCRHFEIRILRNFKAGFCSLVTSTLNLVIVLYRYSVHSLMTSNENDKLWEKCARLLMLNSLERLDLFLEIVSQITGNIAQAPSILKFRSLKYSNATINNKIVETIGGIEFFHGVGFQTTVDEQGTKVLRLTIETSEIVEAVENLQIGLHWLTNTVSTCRTCVSRSILLGNGLSSCAECTIVVRLPTGVAVTGGFMRGEKLHHVRSFACCYFVEAR